MIYFKQPEKFNKKFEIVACFLEFKGKFLLLHRQDYKSEGNTWGLPAGKVDENENNLEAMEREIKEETGFSVGTSKPQLLNTLYVKYPDYDFIYHMYSLALLNDFNVIIENKEHKDYKWVTPEESLNIDLIRDLEPCVKLHYNL